MQKASDVTGLDCAGIRKLPEGMFNKVFELTMVDESAVIARIPNPNVGARRLVVGSEVATLDFVRGLIFDFVFASFTEWIADINGWN